MLFAYKMADMEIEANKKQREDERLPICVRIW